MGSKNRNLASKVSPPTEDIYDVRKNLNKLRQGKPSFNSIQTETDNFKNQSYNQPLNSERNVSPYSESYGSSFNEALYNKYDNLKDSFNSELGAIKDSISVQGTDIRKELNDKFLTLNDSKVSHAFFYYIIGGLITFIIILSTVIYNLSYTELINDNKKNKEAIDNQRIELQKIPAIENKINSHENLINEINSNRNKK